MRIATLLRTTRFGIVCLTLLLFLFSSVSLFSQSAGFGSINGTVRDATGAVVSGASVTVENTAKGIRRQIVSNGAGVFTAQALVPAPGYHVLVTATGFDKYELSNVTVNVGESVDLNAVLHVGKASESIDVTAVAPMVDQTKTNTSTVIGDNQINELPSNGRRVDVFVALTPGVVSDGAFGLLSFRGTPGGNNFLTDGNDTTNAYYDENAGRTRTYNISQDAVQEFQVVSSNFTAEFGKASGGVVNTVTRSGSNGVHGTAYDYWRNATLNAKDSTIPKTALFPNGINPPEWRHQAGGTIGGPIVKDKLFYFFNGEVLRRNAPLANSQLNNGLFDASGNYLATFKNSAGKTLNNCNTVVSATQPLAATQAQCDAALNYLDGRVLPTLVPRTMDNNLLFLKLDYRPNEKDSFSFSGNYVDFRSPNGIQTQLSLADGSGIGSNGSTTVFDRTGRASWTRVVSNNAINEFRFGLFKDRQFDPASTIIPPFGKVQVSIAPASGSSLSFLGFAANYPRLNPSELRYQFADNYSWTIGKHTLKFGAEYAHTEDYVDSLVNRYGSYTYAGLTEFALDFMGTTGTGKHWKTYSQAFGTSTVDVNMNEFAGFVQDQWRITPKLTINPGLRYDFTSLPNAVSPNPDWPLTAKIPNGSGDFAPRLGIAYALNSKTVFHTGFGVFYNRYPTSTIENLIVSSGNYQKSYSLDATKAAQLAAGPSFLGSLTSTPNVTGSATVVQASPDFRNAYSEQFEFGVQRELNKNTSLEVSYVWSRALHLLQTRDANIKDLTDQSPSYIYPVLDAAGNKVLDYETKLYLASDRINPNYGTIAQLESSGNSYYNGLLVNFTEKFGKWFSGNAAYTYAHSIDFGQGGGGNTLFGSSSPTSIFNGQYDGMRGSSSLDQRHRLIVNAVLSPTFMSSKSAFATYVVNGWQLSVVDVAASSQPLVPTISTSASIKTLANGTPVALAKTSTLNGLGGSFRVPWESLSALDIGPIYRTDIRVSKMFPISERVKVAAGFEAFNLFNHTIPGGTSPLKAQQYTTQLQTSGALAGRVALVPVSSYGVLNQTQAPPDGTTARRGQAYVRVTF